MSDELLVARSHLNVLRKRIDTLKQIRPAHTPSEKQLYILGFERIFSPGSAQPGTVVERKATLGGDAAFVATKLLLVTTGFAPVFEVYDQTSGGRQLFESLRQNTPLMGVPSSYFANTKGNTRGADYSYFQLPAEYLLPRNGTLVLKAYVNAASDAFNINVAFAGYKVYG